MDPSRRTSDRDARREWGRKRRSNTTDVFRSRNERGASRIELGAPLSVVISRISQSTEFLRLLRFMLKEADGKAPAKHLKSFISIEKQ
jgi:hypothetical protein